MAEIKKIVDNYNGDYDHLKEEQRQSILKLADAIEYTENKEALYLINSKVEEVIFP